MVDFIVLGAILGAGMMVAGILLRDLVPRRFPVVADETPWIEVRDQRRTIRTVRVAGRLATVAGVTVLLVTVVLVLLDASDGIAWTTVTGVAMVAVLAAVGWVFWYRYQESSGAIQRRQLRAVAARLGTTSGRSTGRETSPPRSGRLVSQRRPSRSPSVESVDRDEDQSLARLSRTDRRVEPEAPVSADRRRGRTQPSWRADDERVPPRADRHDDDRVADDRVAGEPRARRPAPSRSRRDAAVGNGRDAEPSVATEARRDTAGGRTRADRSRS